MTQKVCPGCKVKKELNSENFGKDKNGPNGFKSRCKECKKLENKKYAHSKENYRNENKELINKKSRQRYDDNIELEQERSRKYRENNSEKRKETCAQWIKNNPEKVKENYRRWAKNNPAKVAAKAAKRRAALLNATGSWTNDKKIEALYEERNNLIIETGTLHEVDHIYPLQGKDVCGLHTHLNLQILTRFENRSKSNKMPK
ncbi:MAG: hypothetical protein GY870_16555 [archaeon]|nr:hypothetical protein [archaeon]